MNLKNVKPQQRSYAGNEERIDSDRLQPDRAASDRSARHPPESVRLEAQR
ncbi:hypothetical protein IFO70_35405 [Phormidium tenue FACHB-886]|nr:hypothetical protein [Phormidium tenue FACHB-886]